MCNTFHSEIHRISVRLNRYYTKRKCGNRHGLSKIKQMVFVPEYTQAGKGVPSLHSSVWSLRKNGQVYDKEKRDFWSSASGLCCKNSEPYFSFPMRNSPHWARDFTLSRLHDYTQQDSSGLVISPSQRPLLDKIRRSQKKDIHDPSGMRTRSPRNRAAADPRLRSREHWDRPVFWLFSGTFLFNIWPSKWTFKQQQVIYVKCEYFTNQKR